MPKSNPVIIIPKNIANEIRSYSDDHPRRKAFKKFLEQLKASQLSNGANLEQLMGKEILSVRLEGKARILIAPQKVNGKFAWLLLETLWEHEYDDARFLKKGVLKHFLEKHQKPIEELITATDKGNAVIFNAPETAQAVENPLTEMFLDTVTDETDDKVINATEVCIYNKCIISPTVNQVECVTKLATQLKGDQFASLVTGAPGTGKTLLAYQLLETLIGEDPTAKVYYIADSAHLRRTLQTQWEESPASDKAHGDTVQFYNYEALMSKAMPGWMDDLKPVDDEDLKKFFDRQKELYTKKLSSKTKAKKIRAANRRKTVGAAEPLISSITFLQFRQECDVMASLETFDAYDMTGSSHSLFPGEENAAQRKQLWDLYQSYNATLVEENQYHPQLQKLETVDEKGVGRLVDHVIIVDEACDLSRVQLHNLIQIGARIVFLGDYNQDLTHTSHTVEFLSQEIAKFFPNPHHYITSLDASFRCAGNITQAASTILALKRKVTSHGSALVNTELQSAIDSNGNVEHVNGSDTERLIKLSKSTNTAIVCRAEDKVNVKEKLDTDLVFTVEEIKGLGFQTVILWELISIEQAKRLNKLFSKGKVKRDDISADDKQLILTLNHIYTALTRAELQVILKQSSTTPAITSLIDYITKGSALTQVIEEISNTPSTIEDWLDKADIIYRQNGFNDVSNNIYNTQAEKLIGLDDTEKANDIYRRHVFILNEIGQNEKAKAIEEAYGIAYEKIDYADAEEKHTPPPSPTTPLSVTQASLFSIKTDKKEEPEYVAEAVQRIENYVLYFTSTGAGRSKKSKKKARKTQVTFNRQLILTNIEAIISCAIPDEIGNITSQHLAALLCATPAKDIPIGEYDAIVHKILSLNLNPSIQLSLVREIQILLDVTDINDTVLLKMLKTRQPYFYTYAISAIVDLAKKNNIIRLWLCVALNAETVGAASLLQIISQLDGIFSQLITLAETDTAILNAIFKSFTPTVFTNIITAEPRNFVTLIETAHHHEGGIEKLLKALNQTTKGRSALFYVLKDITCAQQIIELLNENPDAIPDDILVQLYKKKPGVRALHIDDLPISTLEALAELAKENPRICTHFINYSKENGSTFAHMLNTVVIYSEHGSWLLTAMAKQNDEVLREMMDALSFQDERGLSALHYLAQTCPELFMTIATLALTYFEADELTRIFTLQSIDNGIRATPLLFLLNYSMYTVPEFVELAAKEPALYNTLIQTFKLDSKSGLIFISIVNQAASKYNCLVSFLNLANRDDEFHELLIKQFQTGTENIEHWDSRIIQLCNIFHINHEIFPLFLKFSSKQIDKPELFDILKLFNEILITPHNICPTVNSSLLHIIANQFPQYFKSLFEQAKQSPALYSTLLNGIGLMLSDETPLHILVERHPLLLHEIVDYTLTSKSPEEHDKLLKAMAIKTYSSLTFFQLCIYKQQTGLLELAERHPKLQELVTDTLSSQSDPCSWTIVHTTAYYLPNYIVKLVEFCNASSDKQNRLLAALPLSTTQISENPTIESGLQMIAERAGESPLKCIINFIIENIQSAEEERCGKAIELLASFIQGRYNKGNTGLHYIIYADSSCELYEAVLAIAKAELTLQSALDAVADITNATRTSPNQLMALLPGAYTDHCRLFRSAVLPELIQVRAKGKEAAPPAGEEAALQDSLTAIGSSAT
ncbi:MAG: DUF2075 domain-containing protein [Coxiellaceae bacterium]|nr:DUF2075 domain-containing protein [Coxiellaceae bacterium]